MNETISRTTTTSIPAIAVSMVVLELMRHNLSGQEKDQVVTVYNRVVPPSLGAHVSLIGVKAGRGRLYESTYAVLRGQSRVTL